VRRLRIIKPFSRCSIRVSTTLHFPFFFTLRQKKLFKFVGYV
jgi:hypothetical protein